MYITISGKGSHRIVQLRDDRRVPGTDKRKAVIVKNYGNYEKLLAENPHIIEELKEEAKRLAKEAGESAWQPFYDSVTKPAPIFISPTTEAGLVNHVNELGRYPIGAGLLYSG